MRKKRLKRRNAWRSPRFTNLSWKQFTPRKVHRVQARTVSIQAGEPAHSPNITPSIMMIPYYWSCPISIPEIEENTYRIRNFPDR